VGSGGTPEPLVFNRPGTWKHPAVVWRLFLGGGGQMNGTICLSVVLLRCVASRIAHTQTRPQPARWTVQVPPSALLSSLDLADGVGLAGMVTAAAAAATYTPSAPGTLSRYTPSAALMPEPEPPPPSVRRPWRPFWRPF
jgi:hypothetical protein